jgi:radical SAM superfamily enzyme YgiQ (UPF0313 family)
MRKYKVLLIKPKDQADFLNSSIANQALGKAALFPSLSLLTIAGLTPTDDFTVEIFDECLGVNIEDSGLKADIYGLTCFDPSRHRAHEICRSLKKQGKFVVLGGPHATQHHESIRQQQPYDVVFVGDAELTWPRFLSDWLKQEHQPLYLETERVSLEHTPVARYDLCSSDNYLTAIVQTSRGCPYKCEFCDSIVLSGNKMRTKPIERVMQEIDQVYQLGFPSLLIGDDNFTAARNYAKEVLRRIAEWRKDKDPLFQLAAQVSIDVARDDELCELMVSAGLAFAYIGIESSSKDALQGAKKLHNIRTDIPADIAKLHSYGINVMSGLIVGFDEDGPDIFSSHVDYTDELHIPVCPAYLLMAPSGTPLRKRLESEGRIDGEFVSEDLFVTNVIPKRMSSDDLLEGYRWMITQLFNTKVFVRRVAEKFKMFRSRGISPNGTNNWSIRLKHYRQGWAILSYCALHPQAARELIEPLGKLMPVMIRRPHFSIDILNDILLFIRFKSYYQKANIFQEALKDAPRPETWIKETDNSSQERIALGSQPQHSQAEHHQNDQNTARPIRPSL